MVGIVASIGDQPVDRASGLYQGSRDADVVDVSRGQQEHAGTTALITQRMELARFATARLAERLDVGPPFPPPADRWALMCVLSIIASPWMPL